MLPVAILAGGLATRLGHLTQSTPKALIEVAGEPFLAHQLRLLKRRGATRVILCVGHLGDRIREFAADGRRFGLEIEYSFDGPRLLGTGGALRRALPMLGESFLVVYGDSYLPCDYRAVRRAFLDSSMPALMTVFRNEGRGDVSNVEFVDGRIVEYNKVDRTPRMRYIDYGLGAFHAKAFEEIAPDQPYDLATICHDLLRRGQLAAYEIRRRFYEIGSLSGIHELEEHLAEPRRRAVFLDRDGVLNEAIVRAGRPYPPASSAELRIFRDAAALQRLKDAGFLLIAVTNQPDVGRGSQTREAVEAMNARVREALPVDDFYVCFHSGDEECDCRKPKPGLLLAAAADWNIDLERSFMVGDRWRDIDAGASAGCRTIWIDYGYTERGPLQNPDQRVESPADAFEWLLGLGGG